MGVKTLFLNQLLYDYMDKVLVREPRSLRELREASSGLDEHFRQISRDQAQLITFLVELVDARHVLEVGTFRGYSTLAMALAMRPEGVITTCEIDPARVEWARPFWEKAEVSHKINARVGPAIATLDGLLASGHEGSMDFAFLDGDKANQDLYYERTLRLLRPGGLMVLDNVFWGGQAASPSIDDPEPSAVRTLNLKVRQDPRVSLAVVPMGDGVLLARKR